MTFGSGLVSLELDKNVFEVSKFRLGGCDLTFQDLEDF
jgi:hypothetical protein